VRGSTSRPGQRHVAVSWELSWAPVCAGDPVIAARTSRSMQTSERLGTVRSWGRSSCCWCGTVRVSATTARRPLRLREPERGRGPRHRPHGVGGQHLGHPFGPGGRRGRVDAGLLQRPAAPHRARQPAHRAPCGARCRTPLSRSPPPCKRLTAPAFHRGPVSAAPRRSQHPLRR